MTSYWFASLDPVCNQYELKIKIDKYLDNFVQQIGSTQQVDEQESTYVATKNYGIIYRHHVLICINDK